MTDKYEIDVAAWAKAQAEALRQRDFNALDFDNLAEEIDGVGASQRKEIRSRLRQLCKHLLKWQYQSEKRSRSWRSTIETQRDDLHDVLTTNPSLHHYARSTLARAYAVGRSKAELETGVFKLPTDCPWTIDDLLNPEFWPGGAEL